jgi:predicted Zn-dependent protease
MRCSANVCTALAAALAMAGGGCLSSQPAAPPVGLTAEQKINLGRAAAPRIEQEHGGRLENPAVQAYVRAVGERVARSSSLSNWPYHFSVLASPKAGLFALPSGHVYVTRGLLERLETEGELAGLLGHALGHVISGHAERRAGTTDELAAAAAGARVFSPGGAAAPAEFQGLGAVAGRLVAAQYTPEMEAEADRLGLDYMVAAGYHPAEMIRLATLLASMEGRGEAGFARVHPSSADRADAVRAAVSRKYPDRAGRVGREEFQREVLDRLKAG